MNFPAEHFASAGAVAFSPMQQTLAVAAVVWETSMFSKCMHSCICIAEDRQPYVTGLIITDGLVVHGAYLGWS